MISKHSLTKLCKKAGVRIYDDALDDLKEILEEIADRVAEESHEMSAFAGRKTVMGKDVRFAVRKLFRGFI